MDATLVSRAVPPGSLRYLATLYAPENVREFVQAVYVIEMEVRESAASANHDVAHTRLRWWREEIERLNHGRAQHPATKQLAEYPHRIDWNVLQQLVFAADVELSRMTFDDERELRAYLDRAGGAVHEAIAQLTSSEDGQGAEIRTHARQLGALIRHTEVLRDIRLEAHRGRLFAPLQSLAHAGVDHAALAATEATPAVREFVRSRVSECLDELKRARAAIGTTTAARMRPVMVMAALHQRVLERLLSSREQTMRPVHLGNFERVWIAWRAALRAR